MSIAESILRKLIAEEWVGAHGGEYWPTSGDCDEHPLNADEMAYLEALTQDSAE